MLEPGTSSPPNSFDRNRVHLPSFVSTAWRISATVGDDVPLRTAMTAAGAAPSASRSDVVERFAPIATLNATMTARIAIQQPISHVRKAMFNMMSNIRRVLLDAVEMRGAMGNDLV